MEGTKETIRVFTDAPIIYDYHSMTEEVDAHAGWLQSGRILRAVEIEKTGAEGQIMRYGSGLHVAYTHGDFQLHESVRYGNLTLKPEFLLSEKEAGWDGEYATSD